MTNLYKDTAICDLCVGDTVFIDHVEKTVGTGAVKKGFTGYTLWGDPHYETQGTVPVRLYPRFRAGVLFGHFAQN